MRSGPRRSSAHGMSDVAWVGWIDAMTRSANRVKSSDAMTCACSMRGRVRAGRRSGARPRLLERVERDAVPAVADRVDPELPARAARRQGDLGEALGRRHQQTALARLVE